MHVAAKEQTSVRVVLAKLRITVEMTRLENAIGSFPSEGAAPTLSTEEGLTKCSLPTTHSDRGESVPPNELDFRPPWPYQVWRATTSEHDRRPSAPQL